MLVREALILVDLQNDFCPGGALPVPDGERVIGVANRLLDRFQLSVATQDWHPQAHASFAVNHPGRAAGEIIELNGAPQVLWPVHCVQETAGAAFHPELRIEALTRIFPKGTDPAVDSYSGFFDNRRLHSTGLGEYLRDAGVRRVVVAGLATDYCVKFTVLDALQLGFAAVVIREGCRGVELQAGDTGRAWLEMAAAGARVVSLDELSC